MNVQELIDRLTEYAEINPDAEVRLATQPSYPLAFEVAGVASPWDDGDDPDDEMNVVYVCEGPAVQQDPYAPAGIWNMV